MECGLHEDLPSPKGISGYEIALQSHHKWKPGSGHFPLASSHWCRLSLESGNHLGSVSPFLRESQL